MPRGKYYIRQTRRGCCEVCGTVFYSNKPTAAYCSDKCKQAAYRKRKEAAQEAAKLQQSLF